MSYSDGFKYAESVAHASGRASALELLSSGALAGRSVAFRDGFRAFIFYR